MQHLTLEKGLSTFLNALSGKNRSGATIRAYSADISQFISFLHENNVSIQNPAEVQKIDVVEYLSALAKRELTGIARARKMSALREYFRFLEGIGVTACNRNGSGLHSAHFGARIICLYPSPQDHISCH